MKDNKVQIPSKAKVRRHLSADALFRSARNGFDKIPDHRQGNIDISLTDALMSAFSMFSLKDPSVLAFEQRRKDEEDHNLNTIYGIENIPSDTRMREILDEVYPKYIRPMYTDVFRNLQRGKALEEMVFMNGCYLLSLDGTGFYFSEKISSDNCLKKEHKKTGKFFRIRGDYGQRNKTF